MIISRCRSASALFMLALHQIDPSLLRGRRKRSAVHNLLWGAAINLLLAGCLLRDADGQSFRLSFRIPDRHHALHIRRICRLFLTLFVFFFLGSGATKFGYARKKALGVAQEKGGARGWKNATANCTMGAFARILAALTPEPYSTMFVAGVFGAFATAASDTVSSEIGQVLGKHPILITTLRPVPVGTEGAVSIEGTLAGIVASAILCGVGVAFGTIGWRCCRAVHHRRVYRHHGGKLSRSDARANEAGRQRNHQLHEHRCRRRRRHAPHPPLRVAFADAHDATILNYLVEYKVMVKFQHKDEEPAMIIGAHSILYSKDPEADRAFVRDILKLTNVDVGGGWLIFGLPPSEVAVHPGKNNAQEFFLMCDDVEAFVAEMKKNNLVCGPLHNQGWGILTQVTLPGGSKLGVYQPRHARPKPMNAKKTGAIASKKVATKKRRP